MIIDPRTHIQNVFVTCVAQKVTRGGGAQVRGALPPLLLLLLLETA